ncbi:cytokine receptor common subunit gamma isoform X2 [Apteryx mantelli]|uniref:Cytokine receptor common subunit gamma isoform X2 n=1 Tax=Apteryx mantelli TaxID=2696672 RepID=A0ABM4F533_9AVES
MPRPVAFLAPVLLLLLLLLLGGPGPRLAAAARSPPGVECILFNEEYMTCTWGSRETLTTNFSLYYWYENRSPVVECKHYLQDQGVSVGCRFNQSEIVQFQPFRVRVNASLDGKTLEIPSERMELQDLVKPEAPVNLTIHNLSSNQLQLTWSSPYPKAQCLEHAVKYKSNKDTTWTEHKVKGEIFSFPSVDYEKYYTFYVRSKINSYCGSTQLWSEWSVPVVWGNNATSEALSRHRGGAAALVLDPHGLDPHHLLSAPAGPRYLTGPHGKGVGHLHAQDPQSQQELRRALHHAQGQLPGVDRSPQRRRGELQAQLQRERLLRERAAPQGELRALLGEHRPAAGRAGGLRRHP